ncbi:MAG TPA: hypothetical protein VFR17_13735 [Mycobacterium sp.]|nr:hypothetical protein [Mycobacterium sp.]
MGRTGGLFRVRGRLRADADEGAARPIGYVPCTTTGGSRVASPAPVTCDTGNVASRRVIEAHGGVLEDERHGKLRYWLATPG